ncbi:MAG: DsrE family protein [Bacteroidetes bacterium]|nr:DsrE family protein [Bacteroidota bacterium]
MKKIWIGMVAMLVVLGVNAQQTKTEHAQERLPVTEIKTNSKLSHHVVFEVTSNDSLVWKGVMNNVKHLMEHWPNGVQIEVVCHGPGIEMLMLAKTTQQKRIAEFKKAGAVFSACMKSMKARNLQKEDIVAEAGFVPSGVAEVVMKQEEHWSYLKSGF